MKVRIVLHDNEKYEALIESFNLKNYIDELNINPHQMIQFGEIGVAKHMIKIVETVEKEATVVETVETTPEIVTP